ncbi:MAG TPA: LLM class flavin-dependent oxidoreductase [Candidatus Sulfotelmatobacter sp.]|nr:LLM class flavin-dependent oxidoreductase [Candidatus Sulfotelmatobacter sp.]
MKVGLIVPIDDESLGHIPSYPELRDLSRQAEASGLDSIWVFDHLLFRFPGQPTTGIHECWTVLAALADATERVELGTLVMCTAFRGAALLAKMAAALDVISEGRLILGLGTGWHEPEFAAFGYPFAERVGRFEDALTIITGLLRDGQVDFHGRFETADDCVLLPRPTRRIPILVAARGPRMLRLAARHADAWNTAWFGAPDERLAGRRADLAAACAAVGRDPATLGVTVGVVVRYPDLLAGMVPETTPPGPSTPSLSGSAQDVAAGFHAHAEAGAGHLIVDLQPPTPAALERLADAVAVYRAGAGA